MDVAARQPHEAVEHTRLNAQSAATLEGGSCDRAPPLACG